MPKIKVLHITHDLALGGLQQVVVTICRTINRDLFEPSVLCLRTLGDYAAEVEKLGVPVACIPQKNGTDYLSFLKVARFLQGKKIDVIHTHNTQPFIDGTIGALISGGVRTIIHTDHARDFPDKGRYMFAEWFLSHLVDKVVAVSDHTALNLHKYEKISLRKIAIIPNGIDGGVFSPSVDKGRKRAELGIKNRGPIIGIGVRLCEQKGISYLLKAMPGVIASFPDCTLVIAGRGPLEAVLKKETENLGIQANVLFVGMRLDIPELLRLFDVYVLPSLWEGLPMVLLEAMAAECPIVATNVGGVSTAIEDGVTGLLVPPAQSEPLSSALIRILGNQKLRSEILEKAKIVFHKRFSSRIMTRSYERLYQRQFT